MEEQESKEEKQIEGKKLTIKLPSLNRWVVSTILLTIISIILVAGWILTPRTVITGEFVKMNILSKEEIGKKVIDYINNNLVAPGTSASLISVEEFNGIYKVVISYQGQQTPFYVTMDGKYLFLPYGLWDMSKEISKESQSGIPKRDRPMVELYIFSYCPAGVAALDSFSEVADFLKEYADFKVKFFSHGHGEHERQQNMIQECIQVISPDKYWDYAKQFFEKVYQKCATLKSVECDKNESITLMESVGIDSNRVMDCAQQEGEKYYQKDIEDANKLQLRYSPSFVINGVYVERINRSPEGIKSVVCSAFNTPPTKCSQMLSNSSASSSGSCK